MSKIYKVTYGDFMSQRIIGEFLSKSEAEKIRKEYAGYDNWMSCTIIEHDEYDYKRFLKQKRKKKLETIWKNQMNGK